MSKLLIKNGLVVTVDPEDRVWRNGSVYIEDSVIKQVGPAGAAEFLAHAGVGSDRAD